MKRKALKTLTAALALALISSGLALAAKGAKEELGKEKEQPKKSDFYIKASANVGYYFFGSDFDKTIGQVEGIFNGELIKMNVGPNNVALRIISDKKVQRADTSVLPTGNIGIGYIMGRHQFEADMGITGFVTLHTINVKSGATLREDPASDGALTTLGMVDSVTSENRYNLAVTMNEELWIFTPSLSYDFVFMNASWGRLSAGGGAGLMFLSITQKIKFRMDRQDNPAYLMQSSVISTAVGDFGPLLRAHVGYRMGMTKGTAVDVRLGGSWGYVDLHRHVDGSGTLFAGSTQFPISFPSSAMTTGGSKLDNKATTRMMLMGVFLQAGIVF